MFRGFFFHDTATTEFYPDCHTLSLHDALPICRGDVFPRHPRPMAERRDDRGRVGRVMIPMARQKTQAPPLQGRAARLANRSEEHTSELQSLMRISYAVFCLQKKNKTTTLINHKSTNQITRLT